MIHNQNTPPVPASTPHEQFPFQGTSNSSQWDAYERALSLFSSFQNAVNGPLYETSSTSQGRKRVFSDMDDSSFSEMDDSSFQINKRPRIEDSWMLDESSAPIITKTLTYDGICYKLQPQHNNYERPQVWKDDGKKFIIKTYDNLERRSAIEQKMIRTTEGYTKIAKFLADHQIAGFRLPKHYSNPLKDGFLLVEYVDGDHSFYQEWVGDKPLSQLSPQAEEILTRARTLIEKMWSEKVDLGDFRPDNMVWQDGRLVIINHGFEEDQEDLSCNLNHYIQEWAKGNGEVLNFLYANLRDLKAASGYKD